MQLFCVEDCVGVFREGTCLAMPKTTCAPNTSSLKPGSGATQGVLDYGVLGEPVHVTWAGLVVREGTREKDIPRVRMGLSFAWMASLAFGSCTFLSLYPTMYNPRSLRCLYKSEGLVHRGDHNHTG